MTTQPNTDPFAHLSETAKVDLAKKIIADFIKNSSQGTPPAQEKPAAQPELTASEKARRHFARIVQDHRDGKRAEPVTTATDDNDVVKTAFVALQGATLSDLSRLLFSLTNAIMDSPAYIREVAIAVEHMQAAALWAERANTLIVNAMSRAG